MKTTMSNSEKKENIEIVGRTLLNLGVKFTKACSVGAVCGVIATTVAAIGFDLWKSAQKGGNKR